MIRSALRHYFQQNHVCVHEWFINQNGENSIRTAVFSKKRDLTIEWTDFATVKDISELPKKIKDLPVVLILNRKGILHKKIDLPTDAKSQSKLNKVLPNAPLNDFSIQVASPGISGEYYVSVIRNDQIREILSFYKTGTVLACYLGIFCLEALKQSDPKISLELAGNNFVNWDGEVIQSWSHTDDEIILDIEGKKINSQFVTHLAAAISFWTRSFSGLHYAGIDEQAKVFLEERKIKKQAILGLAVFFILLMINAILFGVEQSKNLRLTNSLSGKNSEVELFEKLKAKLGQRQKFINSGGIMNGSRTAFFADQIAASVPHELLLTMLWIQPLKDISVNEGNLELTPNTIIVKGICPKIQNLNLWIKEIKKMNWVKTVDLRSFDYIEESRTNNFHFEITFN